MGHSAGIRLRAIEPSDIDRMYLWENDPELLGCGISSAPYSRHQLWEYVNNYDADPLHCGQLRLMITTGGEAVGSIDLYDIDTRNSRVSVGIMICSAQRRKGIATEALSQIVSYVRNTLNLHQITATVSADNAPSIKLFTRVGFIHTATLRQWIQRKTGTFVDARVFQMSLQDIIPAAQ